MLTLVSLTYNTKWHRKTTTWFSLSCASDSILLTDRVRIINANITLKIKNNS